MPPGDDHPDAPPLAFPEPTVAAIRSLYASPCPLPADQLQALDDRILAAASQSVIARPRPSVWTLPRRLSLAAAATLAVAVSAWFVAQSTRRAAPPSHPPLALGNGGATNGARGSQSGSGANASASGDDRDLNRDGRVDILDALILAKAIDSHAPELSQWSLTRGRDVGRADVDALASSVVKLRSGGAL